MLRIRRQGLAVALALLALAAALLAVATKKTSVFLLVWLGLMATVQPWTSPRRRGWRRRKAGVGCRSGGHNCNRRSAMPARSRPVGGPLVCRERHASHRRHLGRKVVDRSPLGYARVFQSITGPAALALRCVTIRWLSAPRCAAWTASLPPDA